MPWRAAFFTAFACSQLADLAGVRLHDLPNS
jgi:hypothetical protein